MSREAPPIRAAERRQIVATAEGRGFRYRCVMSTVGAKDSLELFRHSVADFSNDSPYHGLRPWLRSVAALRLCKDAAYAAPLIAIYISIYA